MRNTGIVGVFVALSVVGSAGVATAAELPKDWSDKVTCTTSVGEMPLRQALLQDIGHRAGKSNRSNTSARFGAVLIVGCELPATRESPVPVASIEADG